MEALDPSLACQHQPPLPDLRMAVPRFRRHVPGDYRQMTALHDGGGVQRDVHGVPFLGHVQFFIYAIRVDLACCAAETEVERSTRNRLQLSRAYDLVSDETTHWVGTRHGHDLAGLPPLVGLVTGLVLERLSTLPTYISSSTSSLLSANPL